MIICTRQPVQISGIVCVNRREWTTRHEIDWSKPAKCWGEIKHNCINISRPLKRCHFYCSLHSKPIWYHWCQSALLQVMACHLLDEAKLREPILVDSTLWDLGWHLNKIWEAFYLEKCPLNVISIMAASLFRPKCLKWLNAMNKTCAILSIYLLFIIFSKYEINWMWLYYFHFITL